MGLQRRCRHRGAAVTKEETWVLVRRARRNGKRAQAARNAVILANMGLLRRLAERLARRAEIAARAAGCSTDGNLADDLVAAAITSDFKGMLGAIADWDPDRGAFATLLTRYAWEAMKQELPRPGIDAWAGEQAAKIRSHADRLRASLQREVTAAEVRAAVCAANSNVKRHPSLKTVELALAPGRLVRWEGERCSLVEEQRITAPWQSDGFTEDDMIAQLDRKRAIAMIREAGK